MKIGILTFHWSTNYGAVLQCYALQSYLESCGHNVEIIDYKPSKFDIVSLRKYLDRPKSMLGDLKKFKDVSFKFQKEKRLNQFRKAHLHLTERLYSFQDVSRIAGTYDVLISGSDQILNPYITKNAEPGKTSVYFLNFQVQSLKIGYAVSFGCNDYPVDDIPEVADWIQNFHRIGVRETSGLAILDQMTYPKTGLVVPDPTILYGDKLFADLGIHIAKKQYTYVYMLRGISVDTTAMDDSAVPLKYADSNVKHTKMEKWLEDIACASTLITNSYHGMIMAILAHTPFVALLEEGPLSGMNDRFYTLLSRLDLENRIVGNTAEAIGHVLSIPVDWDDVDAKMAAFRAEGKGFLELG